MLWAACATWVLALIVLNELYTDAGRATVFNATNSISYTGTGAATTNQAVYGRITGAQLAAAKKGSYTDTVAMIITYTP